MERFKSEGKVRTLLSKNNTYTHAMVEAVATEDEEEEEGEVVHLAGGHDENNNSHNNNSNNGEDDDENDVVKVSNGEDEKERGEGRYFGSLAKEGKAPPGTNPFAMKTTTLDTKEDIKKMIQDAKRQTEMQRKEREKIEREEREKERLAAENRGLKYVPRAKAGEGEEGGKGDVVRRKVVRAKRPGGVSKINDKEDGNDAEAKTPNAFASLVSGGLKKAVDESKKEESPQKGSVFSRLSKKGGGEEDKTPTETTKKKASSPSPEAADKLARQQQQRRHKSENEDRPGLALFPGLANFKDDENKKPPPKGGAGVFSGFAGFAPKPTTLKQQHRRGGGEPSSSILEEEDENSKPSSSKPLSSFKPSAFAKELGIVTSLSNFERDDEKETTTRRKDSQFAKELKRRERANFSSDLEP